MSASLDQIFVSGKQWLLSWLAGAPEWVIQIASSFINIFALLGVFLTLFALMSVLERKILGRIQNRYGPNRVGPYGLFQPIADGIKMLIKEDIAPHSADWVVHFLAPMALLVPVLLSFSVLPVGRNMAAINLDAGLLFFFAVGAATELAVFMAGWSSRNKYSLLGAMRAIAQMVSYEVPLIISSVTVIMMVGSLSTVKIVEAQADYSGQWPQWHVFTPWGFAGFGLFLVAAMAESNRSPFDLPEGESEIVAGYFLEYSGFKFALFFMAEYLGMFAVSGMAVTLFLGGWTAPLAFLSWLPSWLWFFAKLMALIFLFIWARGTVPRMRMDQLMNFAWKFMLPMALINILAAGLWRLLPARMGRWLACSAVIGIPYILLGRGLVGGKLFTKRTYRYAE